MAIITSIESDNTIERLGSCTSGLTSFRMRLSVAELEIGMRVDELDKPWLESRFLFQGFFIETQADLDALGEECAFVYVTITRQASQQLRTTSISPKAREAKIYHWPVGQVGR